MLHAPPLEASSQPTWPCRLVTGRPPQKWTGLFVLAQGSGMNCSQTKATLPFPRPSTTMFSWWMSNCSCRCTSHGASLFSAPYAQLGELKEADRDVLLDRLHRSLRQAYALEHARTSSRTLPGTTCPADSSRNARIESLNSVRWHSHKPKPSSRPPLGPSYGNPSARAAMCRLNPRLRGAAPVQDAHLGRSRLKEILWAAEDLKGFQGLNLDSCPNERSVAVATAVLDFVHGRTAYLERTWGLQMPCWH